MAGIEEPRHADDVIALPATLHDLRGIDEAAQAVAAECSDKATIRALCVVASEFAASPYGGVELLGNIGRKSCDLIVLTKSDLLTKPLELPNGAAPATPVIATSSLTGDGIPELCALFRRMLVSGQHSASGQTVPATADRCRESIRLASEALRSASDIVISGGGSELVAVEIRAALVELGKVVGAVYNDDLLDRIFSTFCIGK